MVEPIIPVNSLRAIIGVQMENPEEETQMIENTPDSNFEPDSDSDSEPDSGTLLRDVTVFQLKLLMDGFRDVLLSPLSIVAAIVGFLFAGKNSGKYFYRLLDLGHKSEIWINLFNAEERQQAKNGFRSTDDYLREIEKMIAQEYKKGGLLKDAKDRFDRVLDKIPKRDNHNNL